MDWFHAARTLALSLEETVLSLLLFVGPLPLLLVGGAARRGAGPPGLAASRFVGRKAPAGQGCSPRPSENALTPRPPTLAPQ
jgi:hypothetical protein